MTLFRSFLTLGVLAFALGCITEPDKIGRQDQRAGSFSITIQAFANGPTSGKATFHLEPGAEVSTLTLNMLDSLGTTIVISGPGAPTAGADFAIGEEEGLLGGTITRTGVGATEIYALTGGSLSVTGVSATQLVGAIEFTAVQRQGPSIGSTVSGKGTFRATGGNSEI